MEKEKGLTPVGVDAVVMLPCPFCGKKPDLYNNGELWSIGCYSSKCNFQPEQYFKRKKNALTAWNKRA